MKLKPKQSGILAEEFAKTYLLDHGLRFVTQNFFSRFGEIDIIMWDVNCLVFVEVRLRNSIDNAIESVTISKQKKLIKTAQYYLLKHGCDCNCRFDVVAVDNNGAIDWLKNVIML